MTDPNSTDRVALTKPFTAPVGPPPPAVYARPPAPAPAPAQLAPYAPYQPVPAPQPYAVSSTVSQQSNVEIIVAWVFTALTLLYMLPWAVAATRRSTNSILIAVATFFLAWTGIGWLVLLVLSFLGPTTNTVRTTTYLAPPMPPMVPGTWAHCAGDPPNVQRWWDGRAWTGHTHIV